MIQLGQPKGGLRSEQTAQFCPASPSSLALWVANLLWGAVRARRRRRSGLRSTACRQLFSTSAWVAETNTDAMGTHCQHRFDDVLLVFTGTLRTRACRTCDHVEVLLEPLTGEWLGLAEYLSRRVEERRSDARGR